MSIKIRYLNNEVICEEYLNIKDISIKKMACKYNVSPSRIHNILRKSANNLIQEKLSLKKNNKQYDEELVNKICIDYLAEGETITTVGEKYSIPFQTISKILKKSNNIEILTKLRMVRNFKNPSVILNINDDIIGVVANNTKKIFYFPSYLREVFNNVSWNESGCNNYLIGRIKGIRKKVNAHYFVTGSPLNSFIVDHIDRNTTNNLVSNLRVTTRSINGFNCKIRSNNKSGYTGVYFNKSSNKYIAEITISNKKYYLGEFKTLEEASLARLDLKYNLLGYEFMTIKEISQYHNLLEIKAKGLTLKCQKK